MPPANRPKRSRVLIVDDNAEMAAMLADGLDETRYDAVAVHSGADARARLERDAFDALVTDLRMPDVDGLELLALSKRLDPERPVILMTAFSAIDSAVEAIRQGAHHYLAKPFKLDELAIFLDRAIDEVRVRREATALRRALGDRVVPPDMLGRSRAMRAVFEVIHRIAETTVPVLIGGETGTGKGLVAAALHTQSQRASGPFVTVNCAALPETLLESELFGHVKGAFTGATANRDGLFVEAHGGTLFLDEIGELAVPLQAKLLRVLEQNLVRPLGGARERAVDVRVVAATHRDLHDSVRHGTFREDLLYRLDVVSIEIPPLRQRREDLPELIDHFLQVSRARYPNSPVRTLSREALARMLDHAWPGNVRELQHLIERLVLLGSSAEVGLDALPKTFGADAKNTPTFMGEVVPMREMQRRYAAWALEQVGGVRARAADKLSIDIKTLTKLLVDDPPVEP